MYFLTIFSLFFSSIAQANVGDFFASSASTLGLGGQANFNKLDPSNNHYAGSLLASNKSISYSFNFFSIKTHFSEIKNVVVSSPINSSESTEVFGDVDTNYQDQHILSAHGSFNLLKNLNTKLNLSAYVPIEKMLEVSTGDPYRPEYVMYRSRFLRTVVLMNISVQFENFAASIGGLSGFQSNGETYVVARETGPSNPPSNGKMSFNARPSMALTFSVAKSFKAFNTYFSFQDEMKNELTNNASGYTPIGASSLKYDWDLSTMLYYDPRIFRLGVNGTTHGLQYFSTLEYQDWSGYSAPVLKMKDNGGILKGSSNTKNFTTQSIIVPKVGLSIEKETNTYQLGLCYRPSPLSIKSGASGNSIDTDATIYSAGFLKSFKLLEQKFNFNSGIQYHTLKDKKITKSSGRENGDPGLKIGANNYNAGGSVLAVSFGLSWIL